jgi:predicted deacylase
MLMARAIYGPWHDFDLDGEGKTVGHLYIPVSTSRSAYGNLRIPIVVIRGGSGPTALLMAGNHGDEFEGQVALSKLANAIEPAHLDGGLFIMPTANLPAALASQRVSPMDGGNFNTSFPGKNDGGPTEQIAHFVENEILPRVKLWVDLHSGGNSLLYTPLAAIHESDDAALNATSLDLLRAFAAPTSVVFKLQHEYAASSAAQRHAVPYIYGEFGGAATVDPEGLRIATEGTLRALARLKILRGDCPFLPRAQAAGVLLETVTGKDFRDTRRNFIFAPASGVFERAFELGAEVAQGAIAGEVHAVESPGIPPVTVRFEMGGTAIARRHLARVEEGDCLAQIGIRRAW